MREQSSDSALCAPIVGAMSSKHEIVIDMDMLTGDMQVLEKFHECASLMVQSDERREVELGYQMLEIVDACMAQHRRNLR